MFMEQNSILSTDSIKEQMTEVGRLMVRKGTKGKDTLISQSFGEETLSVVHRTRNKGLT